MVELELLLGLTLWTSHLSCCWLLPFLSAWLALSVNQHRFLTWYHRPQGPSQTLLTLDSCLQVGRQKFVLPAHHASTLPVFCRRNCAQYTVMASHTVLVLAKELTVLWKKESNGIHRTYSLSHKSSWLYRIAMTTDIYMPGTILRTSHMPAHLTLITTLWYKYHYSTNF